MPQTCTLCKHPRRNDIDRALLAGDSFRHIAAQYGTSTGALQRHKADHLPKTLLKAQAAQEVVRADTLLADVRTAEGRSERLYGAAEGILERALEAADLKTALNAIRAAVDVMGEARQYMELRGELTGELPDSHGSMTAAEIALNVILVPRCCPQEAPEAIEGSVTPATLPTAR
jgi:hypothetical protein